MHRMRSLFMAASLLPAALSRPMNPARPRSALKQRIQQEALAAPFVRALEPLFNFATIQVSHDVGVMQTSRAIIDRGVHLMPQPVRTVGMDGSLKSIPYLKDQNLLRLLDLIREADSDSRGHIERVGDYAAGIARELGETPLNVDMMRFSARFHDIGKIQVPQEILQKPGRLTPQERLIMQTHALLGGEILDTYFDLIDLPQALLELMIQIAEGHHEWFNGQGYPRGRYGPWIPLAARIVSVADVYDALRNARSYKGPWSLQRALAEIRSHSGTQFDPRVVDAFERSLGRPAKRPSPNVTPPHPSKHQRLLTRSS
jgi:HD-GYP domain-containing protein (c-di-GMP phosphodiesterase class II)